VLDVQTPGFPETKTKPCNGAPELSVDAPMEFIVSNWTGPVPSPISKTHWEILPKPSPATLTEMSALAEVRTVFWSVKLNDNTCTNRKSVKSIGDARTIEPEILQMGGHVGMVPEMEGPEFSKGLPV